MSNELVQKFYIGFYGRPADPEGLEYWAGRAEEEGWTSVRDAFATSDEAQEFVFQNSQTGEQYSNQELINNIYQNLFGRDAEAEGREWYAEKLEAGEMTHSTIVHNIIDGAQNQDATVMNNKLEVAQYFTQNVSGKEYGEDNIVDARSVLEGEIIFPEDAKANVDQVLDKLQFIENDQNQNEPPDSAQMIEIGGGGATIIEEIETPGETDWYAAELDSDVALFATYMPFKDYLNNIHISVYDPDMDLIAENDKYSINLGTKTEQDGTHYFSVQSFDENATGEYEVAIGGKRLPQMAYAQVNDINSNELSLLGIENHSDQANIYMDS